MTTLAVDLGGTRLKAAVLLDGGVSDDVTVVAHEGRWLAALRSTVQAAGADEVALCVPGIVDRGRVVALPGKLAGIEGVDLVEALGVRMPVLVNDAIAYGIGEATCGAGRGFSRVVVVTLGTGVGVAVLESGAPLGSGPFGGGLLGGQLLLGADATIETRCRASAVVASVPGSADAEEAYTRLAAADPAAVQGFSKYRADLVRALTALTLAHAPDCVVVGGGAAQPRLLDGVGAGVRAGLWPGQSVVVRLAEIGDAAALHGLASLVRTRVLA